MRTRAIDLRTSWLGHVSHNRRFAGLQTSSVLQNVHLVELRLCTSCDLLRPQLNELGLEVFQLLLELILVLAPELRCLDFSGRLFVCKYRST